MISLTSPLQIGVYKNNKLITQYITKERTSEALPILFRKILKEFTCKRIFFAKGPGSFMAIKITYIFLRTLSIVENIELYATDGFYFNDNKPIKAMQKLYFVKENATIVTELFALEQTSEFHLPPIIEIEKFSKNIEPLYILPAVQESQK